MRIRSVHAFILSVTLMAFLLGQVGPAAALAQGPDNLILRPVLVGPGQPLAALTPAAAPASLSPAAAAPADSPFAAQIQEKAAKQELLRQASLAAGARFYEPIDMSQPSLAWLVEHGLLNLQPSTKAAFAYIQPYQEPNDWAHRNYCGAGAAIVLLSHWDANLVQAPDIDELGRQIGVNPDAGAWVYRIVDPVNRLVNEYVGADLNWYRYGEATSLDEFRQMLQIDLGQNAVPLITGVMTYGLPGWGATNVGHIVTVYAYLQDPDGTEWVSYADTSPPIAGFYGDILHNVPLSQFWSAVSGNSAQVW